MVLFFIKSHAENEIQSAHIHARLTHTHCRLGTILSQKSSIKPREVSNKAFGRQSPGLFAFPTEQTTLSVRSKNNIKNTPSPVSPEFMGVASLAKEALFWFEFLRSPVS